MKMAFSRSNNKVERKVISRTTRSTRVATRHRRMASTSIILKEMSSSMPPRAGRGSQRMSGARRKSMGRARIPEKTVPIRVRPPEETIRALRVKEPQPGMPEVSPAARLPSPWPMSSWLPSKESFLTLASCLPMARDSTVPSRARARAGIKRSRRASRSKAGGRERGGPRWGWPPPGARRAPPRPTGR